MHELKSATRYFPATDPRVVVMGRVDRSVGDRLRLGFPGVTLHLTFTGSCLVLRATCSSPNCRLTVIVDGGAPQIVRLPEGRADTELACGLAKGEHRLELIRRTEHWQGQLELLGVVLGPDAALGRPTPLPARKLLFIGDSVTCGEGVDRPFDAACPDKTGSSDAYHSYAMLLARALKAQCHLVSYGGRGLVRDYLGNREVLTAPQFFELALPTLEPRVPWDHRSFVPDGILVSLGTNDFNLAIGAFPEKAEWIGAYVSFLERLRTLYPKAQILCTEGAIVNDEERPQRTTLCQYIAAAVQHMRDHKISAVASNQYPGNAYDRHPTGEQHRQMAADFTPIFREILGW